MSFALADRLNANESGELGKAALAWEAAIGGHPAHLVAHPDPACLDAAVSLIDLLSDIEAASSGMGERARDLGQQVRLVLLHAQQVVGPVLDDGCRDRGITRNGIDGDDCALECAGVRQSPQQGRDRHLLTGRVLDRLLAEHEAFVGRKGRDQVQRLAACAAVMAAA
jgi:hypothetical protein